MHTQQACDWLTSVLWSTRGLVHRGSPTKPARADAQCKFVDLIEIPVPAEGACYGQPSFPLLLTSQDSVPQHLRVIINRSLGRQSLCTMCDQGPQLHFWPRSLPSLWVLDFPSLDFCGGNAITLRRWGVWR